MVSNESRNLTDNEGSDSQLGWQTRLPDQRLMICVVSVVDRKLWVCHTRLKVSVFMGSSHEKLGQRNLKRLGQVSR